jgi:hypothetical protein
MRIAFSESCGDSARSSGFFFEQAQNTMKMKDNAIRERMDAGYSNRTFELPSIHDILAGCGHPQGRFSERAF